jgi:cytoskeletal protein CcmA (bactofilin family)
MQLVNGQVRSFTATTELGEFDALGLKVRVDELSVSYNLQTTELVIAGSVLVSGGQLQGASLALRMAFLNGRMQSFAATLAGKFQALGLTFEVNNLTVSYDVATGTLKLFGGAVSLTSSDGRLNGFTATLGSADDDPGLEIVNGKLTRLNVELSGSFDLFGLKVTATDLHVRYQGDLLTITGKAEIQLGKAISCSVELTNGGLVINVRTGAVEVRGLKLVASFSLGPVQVQDLTIEYTSTGGRVTFAASCKVLLPGGIGVGGELRFVNGQLSTIALDFNGSIALGSTGLFITRLYGKLENLDDPANLRVNVKVELTFGKSINVAGQAYSLFTIKGDLTVDAKKLTLIGEIELAGGHLGTGRATLSLDWTNGVYSVDYDVSLARGSLRMKGQIAYDHGAARVTFSSSVTLLGQSVSVEGFVAGDGTFRLHGAVDLDLGGGLRVKGDFTVDKDGVRFQGEVEALGQKLVLKGVVSRDGTFSLEGELHLQIAGCQLDATFTLTDRDLRFSGSLSLFGQSIEVNGMVDRDGRFSLEGRGRFRFAGCEIDVDVRLNNNELQMHGRLTVFGQMVDVNGFVSRDGKFSLEGRGHFRLAGVDVEGDFTLTNGGLRLHATIRVAGQMIEVNGRVSTDGSFSLEGRGCFRVAGFELDAGFALSSSSGLRINATLRVLGQTVEVTGSVDTYGRFTLEGKARLDLAGFRVDVDFTVSEQELRVHTKLEALGQTIEVNGRVNADGSFSLEGRVDFRFGAFTVKGSFSLDNSGLRFEGSLEAGPLTVSVRGAFYGDGRYDVQGSAELNLGVAEVRLHIHLTNDFVRIDAQVRVLWWWAEIGIQIHNDGRVEWWKK